jgi:hypothetical protein
MSENKFKVGDRVAAYGYARIAGALSMSCPYLHGKRGVVKAVVSQDEILVSLADGTIFNIHPKQCRRLKKRERRRVWIRSDEFERVLSNLGFATAAHVWRADPDQGDAGSEYVQLIEVRRKAKP